VTKNDLIYIIISHFWNNAQKDGSNNKSGVVGSGGVKGKGNG
jgi:hypothetical protein